MNCFILNNQLEERRRLEQEHKILLEEEMDRAKMELENELAEIQVCCQLFAIHI